MLVAIDTVDGCITVDLSDDGSPRDTVDTNAACNRIERALMDLGCVVSCAAEPHRYRIMGALHGVPVDVATAAVRDAIAATA